MPAQAKKQALASLPHKEYLKRKQMIEDNHDEVIWLNGDRPVADIAVCLIGKEVWLKSVSNLDWSFRIYFHRTQGMARAWFADLSNMLFVAPDASAFEPVDEPLVIEKVFPKKQDRSSEPWITDCVNEIIESWRAHPKQSKAFTRAETARIAKNIFGSDDREHIMRVAGVRSSFRKGHYNDIPGARRIAERLIKNN